MNAIKVTKQKILYVFTAAPYSAPNGQEGLDAVLMGTAFEQDISVLFVHDGVFQIKSGQDTSASKIKQFTKTFQALGDFDVENLYVFDTSLAARGLSTEQLSCPVKVIDSSSVAKLIKQQHKVFTF